MQNWSDEFASRERAASSNGSRLFRSLGDIAEDEPPEVGIEIGLRTIDILTGGLQPGRLNLFAGYTSHGKTAGMLTAIVNNLDNGVSALFISGDDTDTVVLYRILAMRHGISVHDVGTKGRRWRRDAIAELEGQLMIAAPSFGSYNTDSLAVMINRFRELKGCYPDLVGFDYLTLLTAQGTDHSEPMGAIRKQALAFKELIRTFRETTYMVGHQCNRTVLASGGGECKALSLGHLGYGGEQETDGCVIGFRRKLDSEKLDDDQQANENEFPTVNVSVMKNKVNGRRSPNPSGNVYAIDPISGILRDRTDEERRGRITGLKDVQIRDAAIRTRYRDED